jgi:integrase/recombinase XerD
MFKSLFQYHRVFSRHADGPLAEERKRFLKHLASRGTPRSTLLRYARRLRVIAVMLGGGNLPGHISHEEITRFAHRWAKRRRRRGHARSLKWPREHFVQVACAWCFSFGWLKREPLPVAAYRSKVDAWASFPGSQEALSHSTIGNYAWWASGFLEWLQQEDVPLRQVTLAKVATSKRVASQEVGTLKPPSSHPTEKAE